MCLKSPHTYSKLEWKLAKSSKSSQKDTILCFKTFYVAVGSVMDNRQGLYHVTASIFTHRDKLTRGNYYLAYNLYTFCLLYLLGGLYNTRRTVLLRKQLISDVI